MTIMSIEVAAVLDTAAVLAFVLSKLVPTLIMAIVMMFFLSVRARDRGSRSIRPRDTKQIAPRKCNHVPKQYVTLNTGQTIGWFCAGCGHEMIYSDWMNNGHA